MMFVELFFKLIPFYIYIFLGFLAGKKLSVSKESIAKLLIYIIAPVVIFTGAYRAELTPSLLALPILCFLMASFFCLVFYKLGKKIFEDKAMASITGFAGGSGNTGYFGIPVAVMIFGEKVFPLAVFAVLGFIFYEYTIGFFIVAKGSHTLDECLRKMKKLPALYAFLLGILANVSKMQLSPSFNLALDNFKGVYTILGMMMIGFGLATAIHASFDKKFIGTTFLARFVAWPVLMSLIILLDKNFIHFFNNDIYGIMILVATVPLAANTVAFATELKAHPEKAAVAVLLSTIFAIIYIPIIVSYLLPFLIS